MIFILTRKRRFNRTKPEALYIWQVFSRTIQRASTVAAKSPNFKFITLKLFNIVLAYKRDFTGVDWAVCSKSATLSLPTLGAVTHCDFIDITVIFIADFAA